ncbi:MAG: MotA/TolQ/ExbB proton channel family protein [Elusimicrobiota bacterium]|jgi:chemotaxis protein MotA
MNLSIWMGVLMAGGALTWSYMRNGGVGSLVTVHGVAIVVGGTFVAMLINSSFQSIVNALGSLFSLFFPPRMPSPEEIVVEMTRLGRKAQTEGGLLAVQRDSVDFAGGFLHRAITVAISAGESNEIRRILETEIRQLRIRRQEDSNLFRTMGTLTPMFGLLGTLLGMIRVLETLSNPEKVGPAMAVALSSAFLGIALANMVCIPIAGQIRVFAMNETLLYEMILEGVLDVASSKPGPIIEMHLLSYARDKARPAQNAAGA